MSHVTGTGHQPSVAIPASVPTAMCGCPDIPYDFDRLEMSPTPAAPIPIYVGGLSQKALRRAATGADGWISDLHSTAELHPIIETLQRLRADSDRAGTPLEIIAAVNDAFDADCYRRLRDLGVTHLQTVPWLFYGGGADIQAKCDGIRRFADEVFSRVSG